MNERLPAGGMGDSQIINHLRKENQDVLLSVATTSTLKKGNALFLQYDSGDAIYIIKSGAIEISVTSAAGKKLSLNVMRDDDVFGEIATLDGGRRTAAATAMEDTVLLRIDRTKILRLIENSPHLALDFIRVLCSRLRWVSQQVEDLAMLNIEGRLANRLLILHRKFANGDGLLHLSQNELAEFLGVTRESVNKVLRSWLADGIVELTRGTVRVLDVERLSERCSFL